MLIDTILFNGEIDLLEFRLKLLDPFVDKFVVVESNKTFSGWDRLVFLELPEIRKRLKPWWNKIVPYCCIREAKNLNFFPKPKVYDPSHDCWKIEYQQRNAIVNACKGFSDDDFVLLGDCDEIPSREALEMMKKDKFSGIATFQQFFFYYNLRTLRDEMWPGTIWCPLKALRQFGAQALRDSRGNTGFNVDRGGWHLSNFTSVEGIQNKIRSFSHQEYCTDEFLDEKHIKGCIENGNDLFKRGVTSRKPPDDFFAPYFLENIPESWK